MQSSHHAIRGHTFVVLDKVHFMPKNRHYFLIKLSLRERLKKIASFIAKNFWLNNQNSFYICFNYFHILPLQSSRINFFLHFIDYL